MAYHMDEPDYKLEVRQQPVYARVAIGKEKGMFSHDGLYPSRVLTNRPRPQANRSTSYRAAQSQREEGSHAKLPPESLPHNVMPAYQGQ